METTDLAAIAVTNFLSIFLAVYLMRVADRMRKRKLAKLILDEMGERADTDSSFREIINKNFPRRPMEDESE